MVCAGEGSGVSDGSSERQHRRLLSSLAAEFVDIWSFASDSFMKFYRAEENNLKVRANLKVVRCACVA